MEYRRFGQTNLSYSVFSLGTMRCLASAQVMAQTVQRAIELGINHIETARGYGKSEELLGSALRQIDRERIFLTTKLPPSSEVSQTDRWIDESLQRLQVNAIDSVAIHGLNTWEHLDWVKQGSIKAIQSAIADGRVRHVGFSTHGSLDLILAAIETDFFEFVNLHYSFFFQRNASAIDRAHQKDMGIFIISPADKAGMLHTPPPALIDLSAPFTPLELNYRFLLSDRRITTLSLGAAKPEELGVTDSTGDLSDEEVRAFDRLKARSAIEPNQCSQCYACLPCPESIHIPEVLRLRNLATAYDMTSFGEYRYRMFENAGHWFPGNKGNRCTDCGDCLPRCPEALDIPKLLREAHDRLNGQPGRRLWQD
ncbi:MAG TPA: aldo/keto reductase [Leptolyngbya sp.]|jgi:predicted aldo/keto reductase-like oxidoreductase|nr:aldo/keto reductase [Leptolyngbya sp.]